MEKKNLHLFSFTSLTLSLPSPFLKIPDLTNVNVCSNFGIQVMLKIRFPRLSPIYIQYFPDFFSLNN